MLSCRKDFLTELRDAFSEHVVPGCILGKTMKKKKASCKAVITSLPFFLSSLVISAKVVRVKEANEQECEQVLCFLLE